MQMRQTWWVTSAAKDKHPCAGKKEHETRGGVHTHRECTSWETIAQWRGEQQVQQRTRSPAHKSRRRSQNNKQTAVQGMRYCRQTQVEPRNPKKKKKIQEKTSEKHSITNCHRMWDACRTRRSGQRYTRSGLWNESGQLTGFTYKGVTFQGDESIGNRNGTELRTSVQEVQLMRWGQAHKQGEMNSTTMIVMVAIRWI